MHDQHLSNRNSGPKGNFEAGLGTGASTEDVDKSQGKCKKQCVGGK